jgi:8-oxo-dGTP pyrophosphatase MutT (NUDIX family)
MSALSLEDASARLAGYGARRIPAEGFMKRAAVAAVLRERPETRALEVLLIRRAEHPKDPWSGHMAFPGGRVDANDADPLSTAVRETKEEIGLDLFVHGQRIGELSHLVAIAHGKPLPMIIIPFVFRLVGAPEFVLFDREVQETLWVPLAFLAGKTNRSTMIRSIAGAKLELPACNYEGRTIWGLTLRMLDELVEVVGQ